MTPIPTAAGPSTPPKTPSATGSPPIAELGDDDLHLVLSFIDALVTKNRLRALARRHQVSQASAQSLVTLMGPAAWSLRRRA